jgi:hypothetical protein
MLEGKKVDVRLGGDFDPIPMDKYTVQITDVNLKPRFNRWKGEEEEILNYQFTVLDEKPMTEDGGTTKYRLLWHGMSPSLSAKSWLLKLARAVYGRELTKAEMENFDPEAIVGKQVDVMVEQNPSKDGTAIFNNIVSYSKTLKLLEPYFERHYAHGDKKEKEKSTKPASSKSLGVTPDLDDPFGKAEEEFLEPVDFSKLVQEDVAETKEETEEELEARLAKIKAAKKVKPEN